MAEQATANLPATAQDAAAMQQAPGLARAVAPPPPADQWKPIIRQVVLLVGMAAVVAVGVVTYLWGNGPAMRSLFVNLSEQEAGEVTKALDSMAVPYEIDRATGALLVPENRIHELRMKLASQGLPNGSGQGLDVLKQDQGLGTSQFIEGARYHHALEQELAKSVSALDAVRAARVHLALPKRSAFLRERTNPTASVIVDLYPGRMVAESQVQSIIHLVASSIPHMDAKDVTVVDHSGKLLSDPDEDHMGLDISGKQFAYKRKVEEVYTGRIEKLLEPIVGFGRVRADVNTEMDFSLSESTQERFDPEATVIRSEQATEDKRRRIELTEGVPGTLTNQPPPAGTVIGENAIDEDGSTTPLNMSRTETKNYEVGKIISHTRKPVGEVQKISVAVLIDQREEMAEDGTVTRVPLSENELSELTNLVREVVGFNEARGDSVKVVNAPFIRFEEIEMSEPGILEQGWVQSLGKQLISAIVVLILVFTVLRPMIYGVFGRTVVRGSVGGALKELELSGAAAAQSAGVQMMPMQVEEEEPVIRKKKKKPREQIDPEDIIDLQENPEFEARLELAKKFAREDPALVTNVVRGWLADES